MLQQFATILEQQQVSKMIPFLQSLTKEQRKELGPEVKKLTKFYNQAGIDGKGQWSRKGSQRQLDMLQLACFVCLNMADYEKSPTSIWFLEERTLGKVIDWYCPDWFSDFVNKQANQDGIPYYIHYDRMMALADKGYLRPSKELIAKMLPQLIFEQGKDRKWLVKPEKLLTRRITLEEHIWYLFEVETDLHYSDRYLYLGNERSKEKIGWIPVFKQFSTDGQINRRRLLKEALLAGNRNFNKVLSGWFIELFIELEPTNDEILELQTEMFTVLSSPHSKPVGTVLQFFKKVITDKEFEAEVFLDNTPVLLSSTTKSVVASMLMILERLARKNKAYRSMISRSVMQVFIHADDDLQAKAARIICDNHTETDDSFRDELSVYLPTMMHSARNILKDLFESKIEKPVVPDNATVIESDFELTALTPVETIDDLVFLASQAFDNNQSWHIDWLPASLIQFRDELRGQNIDKLQPALQRAIKAAGYDFRSNQGQLDRMLAIFFIDACIFLVKKYPEESNGLRELFGKFDQKKGDRIESWLAIADNACYLAGWDNHYHDPYFLPHKKLLLLALEKIRNDNGLPLLSTPTHEPGWLYAGTLIEKLALYQDVQSIPDSLDFQIAISHCFLKKTDDAIKLAKSKLIGETRNIILFLLEKDAVPTGPFDRLELWIAALLAKKQRKENIAFGDFEYYPSPFHTGQFEWTSSNDEFTYNAWDYQQQKNILQKGRRKKLNLNFSDCKPKDGNIVQKLFSKFFPKNKDESVLLYDFLKIKSQYFGSEHNDVRRILLLTPNNPEPFLAQILSRCLENPTFSSETDKKMVIAVLQTLHEIWDDFGNMAHVFLGTCMLASDKTVANIAAEIWLKNASISKINNAQLGKAIGLHERIEFAPLKRFTDLVSQTMFRVSLLHDEQLKVLIEHILIELPDEPIKNLKRLLEIYSEVLSISRSPITDEKLGDRLRAWKISPGLSNVVLRIESS